MSAICKPRIPDLMLILLSVLATPALALQMLTEENPPFNYTAASTVEGISTEVLKEVGRLAKVPMNFQMLLWPQAYAEAQSKRDTCIYSTVRLENRERVFKWVGPIATDSWGLYAMNAFSGDIKTLADARPYRIGALTNGAKVEWLKQRLLTNIDTVADDKLNPPRLTLDRKQPGGIDLWVSSQYSARKVAESVKVTDIKLVLKINDQQLWLACHPSVPDDTIKAMSGALAAMKKNGSYGRIVKSAEAQSTR